MKNLMTTTAPRRFSAKCSQILADFKDRVAAELANEFNALNERLIHQVVNEADAVAWTTRRRSGAGHAATGRST